MTATTSPPDPDYTLAFNGRWERAGLILRPVGVTAADRFGDVIAERQRAQRRWDRAVVAVADDQGRCDVFALAAELGPRWWQ